VIPVAGSTSDRIERFRGWVEAFTAALETSDLDAFDRLFAVEATYRPGPYHAVLRGRRAIRGYFAAMLPELPGLSTTAEILGVGRTYGVTHWRLAWAAAPGSARSAGSADGILLVALDPMGRCTAVREWSVEGEGPPDAA
jgi:hypothetical protein